ncbi:MAG: hypothetical protein IT484_07475 [Gammaproteobacteria bacterium]|nr:hypothetical protein [Gammaproteobacteria bacterium]
MTTAVQPEAPRATLPWLGICPLLAGADTPAQGLALGLVSIAVVAGTALAAAGLRSRIPDSARTTGLLLAAVAVAVVMRLACEALDFDMALASGALFALAALHGNVDEAGSARPLDAVLRIGLPGTVVLVAVGTLRATLGPVFHLPVVAFLVLAGLAAAGRAWRGRRT